MIREITETEVNIVYDLAHEIWPDTFRSILSKEQIAYMLAWMYNPEKLASQMRQGHRFFVLEDKGEPVGFMGVEPHFPTPNALRIHKIYLHPNQQGKGLGKALMMYAVDLARTLHCTQLHLNVNRFNQAVAFYSHFGFETIHTEDIDIGEGYLMEDYVMTYRIPE